MAATPTTITHGGTDYYGYLDVSGYQFHTGSADHHGGVVLRPGAKPPDYTRAAAVGLAGVFSRIGIGNTLDQSFDLSYHAAKAADFKIGAYYYFVPGSKSAPHAVEWVTEQLGKYELDLPVMLDLESFPKPPEPGPVYDWVVAFLEGVALLRKNRTVVLYANPTQIMSEVSQSLGIWDSCQARYPYYNNGACTKTPPSDLGEWAGWMPWNHTPSSASPMGEWNAWQFAPCGRWADYGRPSDVNDPNVDVNITSVAMWDKWAAG